MLDQKEERKYTRLRKLGQELHIPTPESFLTLEVFDRNGKLISRVHQRSHSWVRNAYNMMFSNLASKDGTDGAFGAGLLNFKDTGGVVRNGATPITIGNESVDGTANYGYRSAVGDDTRGILVGTGTDAESFEDFVLQTPIADGAGGGQLNHVEGEAHVIDYAALTLKNTLVRYFNNNSGGGIGVNEVALVAGLWSGGWKAVVSRDKLPTTVTVPNTGQLKVTYTVELTYPS